MICLNCPKLLGTIRSIELIGLVEDTLNSGISNLGNENTTGYRSRQTYVEDVRNTTSFIQNGLLYDMKYAKDDTWDYDGYDDKNQRKKVGVFPVSEGSWLDTGEWGEYNKTQEKIAKRI